MNIPQVKLSLSLRDQLCQFAASGSLEEFEAGALDINRRRELAEELASADWYTFVTKLSQLWRTYDHVVVRGLPVIGKGITTLLLGLALDADFKSYRGDKIVKHFKLSPWTAQLSQTLLEGEFHTDLSTADQPPPVTMIHCREPDPTIGWGLNRVVRVPDLLAELRQRDAGDTLQLLLEDTVEMVDERAKGSWSGVMADDSTIRFHPETLRAAERRGIRVAGDLENHLNVIRNAAFSASEPVELGKGDVLIVSNKRALHYRGACTVQYEEFPRRFNTREVHVLHLLSEPAWHA